MKITTKRLELIPLSLDQFNLLLSDRDKLIVELRLKKQICELNDEMMFAMKWLYKQCLSYPQNHIWYTNWQIILKNDKISIGSFCFKGEPNLNGEVEIGYVINEEFRRNGYMYEALDNIIKWLAKDNNLRFLIAETDKDNTASKNLLAKSGFKLYKEKIDGYWWKYKIV